MTTLATYFLSWGPQEEGGAAPPWTGTERGTARRRSSLLACGGFASCRLLALSLGTVARRSQLAPGAKPPSLGLLRRISASILRPHPPLPHPPASHSPQVIEPLVRATPWWYTVIVCLRSHSGAGPDLCLHLAGGVQLMVPLWGPAAGQAQLRTHKYEGTWEEAELELQPCPSPPRAAGC